MSSSCLIANFCRIEYQKRQKRASPPEEENNNEYGVLVSGAAKRKDSESAVVPVVHVDNDDKGPAVVRQASFTLLTWGKFNWIRPGNMF